MIKIVNTSNNKEWNSAVRKWRYVGDGYPSRQIAEKVLEEMPEDQREIAEIKNVPFGRF